MIQRILDRVIDDLVPNVGNRCTLVCAATLLRYHGCRAPGLQLAMEIGVETRYSPTTGPPALAYVALPWRRPSLDVGIELVGRRAGCSVRAQTRLIPPPGLLIRAIDEGSPVVLNMLRAPSGTWSHSVIAHGYRLGDRGPVQLLTADPNQPEAMGIWLDASRPWRSRVVTATFVSRKTTGQVGDASLPP